MTYLQSRLPHLPLNDVPGDQPLPELRIKLLDWQHERVHIPSFDRMLRMVEREGDFKLVLWTRDWLIGVQAAYEVLNRYQRLLPWPTVASNPSSARLLQLHDALYRDTEASGLDRIRTLDCFHWLHRLEARPSASLQSAALLGGRVSSQEHGTLTDAHDLAFFGTGSWHFLATFGFDATRDEVQRRMARMSQTALCLALMTRQPREISSIIDSLSFSEKLA